MAWRIAHPLPDDLRALAIAALEHGMQVIWIADPTGEADHAFADQTEPYLEVGEPHVRVFTYVRTQEQLDRFVDEWTFPDEGEDDAADDH